MGFKQEVPYGTKKTVLGVEFVYIPDPYTFPIGWGDAWCSVEELEEDGIDYPREEKALHTWNTDNRIVALNLARDMPDVYSTYDLIEKAKLIEKFINFVAEIAEAKQDGPLRK